MSQRVLFICHGNICRSPAAMFIFRDMLAKQGLEDVITCASAATSTEEIGNPIYPPMERELTRRGIACKGHRARQITRADYDNFDYLVIMDERNARNIMRFYGADPEDKIHTLMSYTGCNREIADPWYTGDFGKACDDITEGCMALLKTLTE
ncbi:MAG: low molecular weight protein-tyrosine-phosphatase [Lachnospiraceae bacterium]|nr:low molecular weight protein-tyrosine-phosphatase [Lachnospiraceae bacterium]